MNSDDIGLEAMLEFVLQFAVYCGWPKASHLEGPRRRASLRVGSPQIRIGSGSSFDAGRSSPALGARVEPSNRISRQESEYAIKATVSGSAQGTAHGYLPSARVLPARRSTRNRGRECAKYTGVAVRLGSAIPRALAFQCRHDGKRRAGAGRRGRGSSKPPP